MNPTRGPKTYPKPWGLLFARERYPMATAK
jgi:hypothetical protein